MSTRALPIIDNGWVLSGLRVDNLRALRMDEPLELRRLMLVVGRNGIGKSTLIRVLPLLRQSAGDHTREPILWWFRNGVDLGSFAEAKRRGQEVVSFGFEFSHAIKRTWQATTTISAGAAGSRVKYTQFAAAGSSLRVSLAEDGTWEQLSAVLHESSRLWKPPEEFPDERALPWQLFAIGQKSLLDARDRLQNLLVDAYAGTKLPPIGSETDFWRNVQAEDVLDHVRRYLEGDLWNWRTEGRAKPDAEHALSQWQPTMEELDELRWHSLVTDALTKLRSAGALVDALANRTAYIGPFRAIPERDYRHQSVAVESLDARGENLAMFLAALEPDELADLDDFLQRTLDFRLALDRTGGRYALRIILDGQSYNLLDVGFGYSQVLPVAVQLWASGRVLSTSRTKERLLLLAIEQPELHLHPHHQVLVARALAASAMTDEGPMQLIETHSDHIVSEIGLLVARGELDRERVGVVCVEPHPDGDGAAVRLATYDEDGVLQNWPAGFLSP